MGDTQRKGKLIEKEQIITWFNYCIFQTGRLRIGREMRLVPDRTAGRCVVRPFNSQATLKRPCSPLARCIVEKARQP